MPSHVLLSLLCVEETELATEGKRGVGYAKQILVTAPLTVPQISPVHLGQHSVLNPPPLHQLRCFRPPSVIAAALPVSRTF